MTTIYLARHGKYQNKRKIIPFRIPGFYLSKKGKNQVKEIASYLLNKKVSFIYSSPILRCKQTTKIIGNILKIKPIYSSLITETLSPLQGITLKEFSTKEVCTFKHSYHLHNGGETWENLFKRTKKLIDKVLTKHQGKSILLISHGDPSMSLIYGIVEGNLNKYFQQTKTYIPKGGLAKFEFLGKKLKIFEEINY